MTPEPGTCCGPRPRIRTGRTPTAPSTAHLRARGAQPCTSSGRVGCLATLGTHSTFIGTVLALTSSSVTTGVAINGRALAQNGSVTLDADNITPSTCTSGGTTGGTAAGTTGGATGGATAGTTGGTGGQHHHHHHHPGGPGGPGHQHPGGPGPRPIGGIGAGTGSSVSGLDTTEVAVGSALASIAAISAGAVLLRRRATTRRHS
ncbi:DUF3494 domain-containing protein [Streptacidiphilus sp. PB12-B1b]|uniref:ice-binding family protein n=1 Tax=Streptacidiphilus sp. PB12-B1b TaxID=2705012 RepID=UPI0015FDC41E|nr:ice-binding family protein [Streptacidiphilus sp. PB12-B1b]QMU78315.1 DUF3494 domain-containing protein [Streptacidiphilus sp. PB12-B1b]